MGEQTAWRLVQTDAPYLTGRELRLVECFGVAAGNVVDQVLPLFLKEMYIILLPLGRKRGWLKTFGPSN